MNLLLFVFFFLSLYKSEIMETLSRSCEIDAKCSYDHAKLMEIDTSHLLNPQLSVMRNLLPHQNLLVPPLWAPTCLEDHHLLLLLYKIKNKGSMRCFGVESYKHHTPHSIVLQFTPLEWGLRFVAILKGIVSGAITLI